MYFSNRAEVIRIVLANYEREIYPWVQRDLTTPFWRFYWDPTPGGVLDLPNGKCVELTPETFTVIPGYLRFSTRATQPFEQFYIHFQLDGRLRTRPERLFQFPADAALRERIGRCLAAEHPREALLRQLLLYQIVLDALELLPSEYFLLPEEPDERIAGAVRLLRKRMATPPDNSELARCARMSVNGFVRLFSREYGESPQAFGRRLRLEFACELLCGDSSIGEIAEKTGFADRYHFSRAFCRLLRQTPAGYRRQHRRTGD